MAQSYDEAAAAMDDRGFIDPHHVSRQQVEAQARRFLNVENAASQGAYRLINETTDIIMNQRVNAADGTPMGKRSNITTYTDRWGNLMGRNTETGTRRKLLDSGERQ